MLDTKEAEIMDLYSSKFWGLKFATTAACTVLSVDQVFFVASFVRPHDVVFVSPACFRLTFITNCG